MRIYAVADLHGRTDRINLIKNKVSELNPDIVVIAGDITNYSNPGPIISQINELPIPVMAIRGNTDRPKVEDMLKRCSNITALHLNEIIMDGIPFIGASGTVPIPFSSRLRFRERRFHEQLELLINRQSVLVVHPPPWGLLDEAFGRFHAGCRRLLKTVMRRQPRLVICGHIHERPGLAFIRETLVVNCSMGRTGNGALIDLDTAHTTNALMI
ncbi:MAG: metallophosphoesterase family protein [Deltaproteobacteria bacterium]|nr:metallophosphoesterase family protein [Deltaproteobacteria bacterium]